MKIQKADIIFILILTILGIILSIILYLPRTTTGDFVEVRLNGERIATYPLDTECTETIEVPGGSNTFYIKDGAVSMTEADCHDKVCVTMKSISRVGETIVCLPHKLVLEVVTKDSDAPTMDAVTGGVS